MWDPETETFIEQFDDASKKEETINLNELFQNQSMRQPKLSSSARQMTSIKKVQNQTMAVDIEDNYNIDKAHMLSFTEEA